MADPRVNYRISAIDDTKKAINQVKSNFGGLKKVLAGLTVGLSVGGLTRYVGDLITKTDQLDKLTKKIKVDVEEFQRLALLAERQNVGQDVLGKALEGQSRKIAEAVAGAGEAKAALEAINLDPASLFGLDPIAQFQAIAEALRLVEDGGTALFAAQKVWEDQGTPLLNLIREQGYELNNLSAATSDIVVKTREQTEAAAELLDAWTALKQRLNGAFEQIALKVIPQLQRAVDALAESLDPIAELLEGIASAFATAFSFSIPIISDVIDYVNRLAEGLRILYQLMSSAPTLSLFGSGGTPAPARAPRSDGSGLIQRFNSPVFVGPPRGALE